MALNQSDPFYAAASELVDDIRTKREWESGEVSTYDQGFYTVSDSGELEFVASYEDMADEIAEIRAEAQAEAIEQAAHERRAAVAVDLGLTWIPDTDEELDRVIQAVIGQ